MFSNRYCQKNKLKIKIYSLHEPKFAVSQKVTSIKKYEYGNQASSVKTDTGVIVRAMGYRNEYDGHTLLTVLE